MIIPANSRMKEAIDSTNEKFSIDPESMHPLLINRRDAFVLVSCARAMVMMAEGGQLPDTFAQIDEGRLNALASRTQKQDDLQP